MTNPLLSVLVLDDDLGRHSLFREWGIGRASITHVETASRAIAALEASAFNLVFLDHDLGGQVYCESGPGTGQEVADWLFQASTRLLLTSPTPKIIVHSWNPDGGKRMFNTLADAGYDVDRAWFGPNLQGYFL